MSTVLGVLGQDAAVVIADATTADSPDLATVIDGLVSGNAILQGVAGAGAGAVTAYLLGELLNDIGLTGAPAQVVESLAGATVSQIAVNLVNNVAWDANINLAGQLPNILGGLLGTELGDLVYSASTVQGEEGAAVGSAVGGVIGSIEIGETIFGVAIPGIGVAIGAFLGDIIGGLIGDLFGEPTTSAISLASLHANGSDTTPLSYNFTTSLYQNGSQATANSIGDAVMGALNTILAEVGGVVSNETLLTQFTVGVNTDSKLGQVFYYDDNSTGVRTQYQASDTTLQQIVDFSVLNELGEMVFSGGDPYIERAIDYAFRTSATPSMTTLSGAIQIAEDYETYEANRSVINALIEADPASSYSAGWLTELEIAAAMGFGTSIQGGTGDDTLRATSTLKILIGGGSDSHGDTYLFDQGDGKVTILNGVSTMNVAEGQLDLGAGLQVSGTSPQTNFTQSGSNLIISFEGDTTDQVTVEGWFADSYAQLGSVSVDNGADIYSNTIIQWLSGEIVLSPPEVGYNEVLNPVTDLGIAGTNAFNNSSNVLAGGDGDDVLAGTGAGNTFITGGGSDVVYGGGGNDAYDLSFAGDLTIYNGINEVGTVVGTAASGSLVLGTGMTLSQLSFTQSGENLVIGIANSGSVVTIENWYADGYAQLSSIVTADGYTIAPLAGSATNLYGTGGADLFYRNVTTGQISIAEFSVAGAIVAGGALAYTNGTALDFNSDTTIIATGAGFYGTGGFDLFVASGAGAQLGVYQFNSQSQVTAGGLLSYTNGTALTVGAGTTIIATGTDMSNGDAAILLESSGGQVTFVDVTGETVSTASSSADLRTISGQLYTSSGQLAPPVRTVGTSGNDIFTADGGTNIVYGAGGSDTYDMNYAGDLTIYNGVDEDGTVVGTGASGTLAFASALNISASQLVFSQVGDNLVIDAAGLPYQVTVANWFAEPAAQLQTIISSNGRDLTYVNGYITATISNAPVYWLLSDQSLSTSTTTTAYIDGTGVTLTGSGDTLNVISGASGTIDGNNDWLNIAGGGEITADGTGDTLNINGTGETATVSNGSVNMVANISATIDGTVNWITVAGGDTVTVNGSGTATNLDGSGSTATVSNFTVNIVADASATVTGNNDWINAAAGDSVTATGTGDTLNIEGTGVTGTVSNIGVAIANGVSATIDGTGDWLTVNGNDAVTVSGSGDTFSIQAGGNTLTADNTSGVNTYYDDDGSNGGATTIVNGAASNTTATNDLNFGGGVTDENLWFAQSGNNLLIDVMGTNRQLTVAGWFSSPGQQLAEISADGLRLDAQLNLLVQYMAAYSGANPGFNPSEVFQVPNDATLQNAIAASWHS